MKKHKIIKDTNTCSDINECLIANFCSSNSICENTLGGYEC